MRDPIKAHGIVVRRRFLRFETKSAFLFARSFGSENFLFKRSVATLSLSLLLSLLLSSSLSLSSLSLFSLFFFCLSISSIDSKANWWPQKRVDARFPAGNVRYFRMEISSDISEIPCVQKYLGRLIQSPMKIRPRCLDGLDEQFAVTAKGGGENETGWFLKRS